MTYTGGLLGRLICRFFLRGVRRCLAPESHVSKTSERFLYRLVLWRYAVNGDKVREAPLGERMDAGYRVSKPPFRRVIRSCGAFSRGKRHQLLAQVNGNKNDWTEGGRAEASDIAPIKMVRSWCVAGAWIPFSSLYIEKGRSHFGTGPLLGMNIYTRACSALGVRLNLVLTRHHSEICIP